MSSPIEWSAGGVVIREASGIRELAVIQPRGKTVLSLPKGHIDEGETPEVAAVREVCEETGLHTALVTPLGDIQYEYRFRGRLVRKKVSFFLLEYQSGTIDALEPRMRVEVSKALWVPLDAYASKLAYAGEKEMVKKAISWLEASKG